MSRSGALSHGFKRVWNDPLLFSAELAWRWTFSLALVLLCVYAVLLFLHSLPVSDKNLFRLSGLFPGLYLDALASIFRGSGPKMLRLAAVLLFGSSVLWLVSSSWGRAITLAELLKRRVHISRVSRFHFLRLLFGLLSFSAYLGGLMFAFSVGDMGRGFDFTAFYFTLIPIWLLITLLRGTIGWWIALAPFVEQQGSMMETLRQSSNLAREGGSQFAWVNFVLGLLRFVNLVAGWMLAFSALIFFAEFPDAYFWAALGLIVVLYSLVKTWLNTWELAAYVRVIEWDGTDPFAMQYVPATRPPLLDPPVVPAM